MEGGTVDNKDFFFFFYHLKYRRQLIKAMARNLNHLERQAILRILLRVKKKEGDGHSPL